jgi:hypothetical protein
VDWLGDRSTTATVSSFDRFMCLRFHGIGFCAHYILYPSITIESGQG